MLKFFYDTFSQADLAAIGELPGGTISSASHREGPSQAAIWFLNSDMTLEARLPGPYGGESQAHGNLTSLDKSN